LAVEQGEVKTQKRGWGWYLVIGIGLLLTVLVTISLVLFWQEMWDVGEVGSLSRRYGYLIGFLVSIMGGITVIPFPSLLVIFNLGHILKLLDPLWLNPLCLGLLSGLGEALGGITVYLTGAGGGAIWSKFRAKRPGFYTQPSTASTQPGRHSRWQKLYHRLIGWVERRGTSWFVFITSAFIWGLYYPAGLAAGTLHMGLKRFFFISWAGKTIRGMIIAFGGYWGLHFLIQWIGG